jgi:hypothetical protein
MNPAPPVIRNMASFAPERTDVQPCEATRKDLVGIQPALWEAMRARLSDGAARSAANEYMNINP